MTRWYGLTEEDLGTVKRLAEKVGDILGAICGFCFEQVPMGPGTIYTCLQVEGVNVKFCWLCWYKQLRP